MELSRHEPLTLPASPRALKLRPTLRVGFGLYQDGVYRRMAAGNLQLADIECMEILRGLQGTMFGRNTRAGTINIVTRRPDPRQRRRATEQCGRASHLWSRGILLSEAVAGVSDSVITVANARAVLRSADRKHQFAISGSNILDEEAHYITINFALNNTAVRYPINPLTVDLSYTYRF
jgi:hypothetical protein